MGGMLETIRNAWKIPDLRKKMLFTILMLVIYRIGAHIPVPGLDADVFARLASSGGQLFGYIDIISGGAFQSASIFAMSITPYINSSIIMQLLTVAIPKLEQLAKEGEEGRKLIAQYTRYVAVALGFLQATGLYFGLSSAIIGGRSVISYITITLTFTAGTAFLMWLGEQITESGVGNGISLIIFAGIVSRGPRAAIIIANYYTAGTLGKGFLGILAIIALVALFIAVMAAVIWVNEAERRIPVQYAKRVVGRKVYGGQSTHIPIKVNLAGVMPIIFAMSITSLPSTLISFFAPNSTNPIVLWFKDIQQGIGFALINAVLIMFFTFFYTVIQFNPVEIANNMKKNGGFIPGIRPGRPTSDYISKVLNRLTWFGGLFLALITIFPTIFGAIFKIQGIWFGGTSLLILVGVALDTVKQIESQMLMRHYKGFLE
ncbi:preprotein translocase subunit SecY [Clostridium thermosuccinogenes]|jgi:preprotein translocase subunit SecY|uniref:Protein translocase subunit SecY n=1 Tax=Clostridium thermosuccinogenes TaxID=84032 RepID=A0A2K2FCT3_9CLOT|nr:preprotein translocase subunit SecY [Pseudoclostridium thermosuccinogenes]AUS98127.1 preprotein translocase subunit SecY [Pseudoclostridium thermosuccinogenes]PNT91218.1 preprotein translocase subunit SecY [Pseudoclostridium thermosuccinogenes]PNT95402.1 preprotein translocase subunit SecY [Pseudoclostridium thermosuccinogenes]PNT96578.1 preprotein translocase subunit SecY [Pseudoclostridium thermosuccinogenes]